jgi:hypothetical protein
VLQEILDEEFPRIDRPRGAYTGPHRTVDLMELLDRAEIEIFMEVSDGMAERKYALLCPWHEEHSNGDTSGSYAGQYENGALFYFCHHAHCAHRRWREFRHHLEASLYLGRSDRRGRLR